MRLSACAWRRRAPGSISRARRTAESPCAGRRPRRAAAAPARSAVGGRRGAVVGVVGSDTLSPRWTHGDRLRRRRDRGRMALVSASVAGIEALPPRFQGVTHVAAGGVPARRWARRPPQCMVRPAARLRLGLFGADRSRRAWSARRSRSRRSTTLRARCACDGSSYIVSSSTFSRIVRRPRAPVLRCMAPCARPPAAPRRGTRARRLPSRRACRYCLMSAFFGSVRIEISAASSSSSSVATTGRRPTNSGIRPNLIRSSGSTSWNRSLPCGSCVELAHLGGEADAGLLRAVEDDLLQPGEGAAADEQDVGGVDLQEFLLRVLAAALRRHRGDRALDELQQRLLHALARDVARDRRVVGLARDLVDLVDVDDAASAPSRRRSRTSAAASG